MPRSIRIFLCALGFAVFGFGSLLLGVVIFPLIRLFVWDKERFRKICSTVLHYGYPTITGWGRFMGLVNYQVPPLPAELDRSKPYIIVATHPTLIDISFLLGAIKELRTVVKMEWSRFFFFRALLGSTHYLPVSGDAFDGEDSLDKMVKHLEAGHSLVTFPEGSRSLAKRLRRFKRGPFEAAIRAGVPIVPLFIGVDSPVLMKGQKLSDMPNRPVGFTFEWQPIVDPESDNRSSKELCAYFQSKFNQRFELLLAERKAMGLLPEQSAAPEAAE